VRDYLTFPAARAGAAELARRGILLRYPQDHGQHWTPDVGAIRYKERERLTKGINPLIVWETPPTKRGVGGQQRRRPFVAETTIVRFASDELVRALEVFEASYAEATGEVLASRDFYERYRAGELDSPFAMAWATFFEAATRRDPVRAVEEALPPVLAVAG
jgi:hypothetical protein